MKAFSILAIFGAALVGATPVSIALEPALAEPTPNPGTVRIRGVTYGGSGCPQGSVGQFLSADATTVTLIFDSYVASLGPSIAVAENRKNCQINFDLLYPGGFQYSVFTADYRGYANLDKGVTGQVKSTYYFSGSNNQASDTATFTGPLNGDYLKTDKVDQASTVWSPCGAEGALNINSQIRLTASDKKSQGLLTTDSLDAKFTQILHLQWQKCEKK
jgi:hypothetical protein